MSDITKEYATGNDSVAEVVLPDETKPAFASKTIRNALYAMAAGAIASFIPLFPDLVHIATSYLPALVAGTVDSFVINWGAPFLSSLAATFAARAAIARTAVGDISGILKKK